jgi:hypothetical protein
MKTEQTDLNNLLADERLEVKNWDSSIAFKSNGIHLQYLRKFDLSKIFCFPRSKKKRTAKTFVIRDAH